MLHVLANELHVEILKKNVPSQIKKSKVRLEKIPLFFAPLPSPHSCF